MAKARSIRVRYTLRALFVFITLFMLWGGYHTNRSWKERAAEDVLRARGASCHYAKYPIEGDSAARIGAIYSRIVQFVWQERSVTWVSLAAPPEAEVVNALAALPHLQTLYWEPARPTPEQVLRMKLGKDLEPTHSLPAGTLQRIFSACRIQGVAIGLWRLSDEDCHVIASQPGMQSIIIDGCSLSEKGFAELITTPGIRWFSFRYCDVTGSELADAPGSSSLERIQCGHAPLSTAFAQFVARSPNITELSARRLLAGDDFVRALGPHPSLTTLGLGQNVTDNCLADIARMPALGVVGLPRAGVSQQGVARLRAAKPQLLIQHY